MKYMGSKHGMLKNGLADILASEVSASQRFIDLFTGSGVVAWHVAERSKVPVLAFDLQMYSVVLANAIISRRSKLNWGGVWATWLQSATELSKQYPDVPSTTRITKVAVSDLRDWASEQNSLPITRAYGGHYFSPLQSMWIDVLRQTLPESETERTVALAALVQAASQCVAAPGHTAQPFQPTKTAKKFIQEAWGYRIPERTKAVLSILAGRHALRVGHALVADANKAANQLREGDLAFIDPPYSGVHYSRFYHVLETISRGISGEVSGVGRYPSLEMRPRSKYSLRSEAELALDNLLAKVAAKGAKAIVTFPDHVCSNGLSGELVHTIASKYFLIVKQQVNSKFSTLGGKGDKRGARQPTKELLLVLTPK
jgi:adenine-specific DNA-methyltransferase